jgi:hypothetical protein
MAMKASLKRSRKIYPWIFLWTRCRYTYNKAKESEENEYLLFFSMLLCAFTLEAFLNHLLSVKYLGDWKSVERKYSPYKKLNKASKLMNLNIDKTKRPYSTFQDIFTFRNDLAHAKSDRLEDTIPYPIDKILDSEEYPEGPLTRWENHLIKDADRFFEDSEQILDELISHSDLPEDFFTTFSNIIYSGSINGEKGK